MAMRCVALGCAGWLSDSMTEVSSLSPHLTHSSLHSHAYMPGDRQDSPARHPLITTTASCLTQ